MKIGILGIGNIGAIFAESFAHEFSKNNRDDQLYLYDINSEKCQRLSNYPCIRIAQEPLELCRESEIIFIAVKPQDAGQLFSLIKNLDYSKKVVVSTMTGITTTRIESELVTRNVVRIMPNVPISIGKGVIGICFMEPFEEEKRQLITRLLGVLGCVVPIREKDFAALTALSGSSPAFVFVIVETLIDAGLMMGLSYDVAKKLVLETLTGSAQMLLHDDEIHPAVMRNKVTSPAGTTIEGIYTLEREGLRGILMKILIDTYNKAKRMSGEAEERHHE